MNFRARLARMVGRVRDRIRQSVRQAVTPNRARYDAQAARVARVFKRTPPSMKDTVCDERTCGVGGWQGRYDPKTHTVHRAMEKRMPRARRKALKGHEIAHGLVCDRTPAGKSHKEAKKCTYHGEHSPRYYRTAAKVQRQLGTDPKEALELERMSGYSPPKWYERMLRRKGKKGK